MKTLLRIIESTLPIELASPLEAHASVCRIDGWSVVDVYAPKRDAKNPRGVVDIAERIIWPMLPVEDLHVFAIGDLPIPRSGMVQNPDGHTDTSGAYPCPGFWASGSQIGWTDSGDNTRLPSKPQFEHTAGDYVWDQDKLPADAKCAIGILNLSQAAKNKAWGFTGPQSTWTVQAYQRYFDFLLRWRTNDIRPIGQWAHGHWTVPTGNHAWLSATDSGQPVFRSATAPRPFDGPYAFMYDMKALPPGGDFWFERSKPVAAVYSHFESYQWDWTSARNQNALESGSACAFPMGSDMWDLSGWQEKTMGQLWMQTAKQGKPSWMALYGDPTFRIPTV